MSKIKQIYVMNEEGLSDLERKAVLDGTKELLKIAGVEDKIKVVDFGAWRNEGYRNRDGSLKEYQSIDWYLQEGRRTSRNSTQLNADTMINLFITEPWQKGDQEHYDIIITQSDIYSGDANFVIGVARESSGTVISTNRFKGLKDKEKYECVKTETMHELGHVFGLIPSSRKENVEDSLGKHCTNTCIMRQGMYLPTDWENMTNDRLKHGPLCNPCETHLKNYFKEKPPIGKPKIIRYTRRG